tara:strand:+ start:307 stop:468 length:162 start_codon:yes stop_codon:yes gene_type:complete
MPNYQGWKPTILRKIIQHHSDTAIIYFDYHTRNNLQNKYFAKAELNQQKKRGK